MDQYRGTTIVSIRRGNKVVIGGDGQVSQGNTVMKGNARKVRRLYKDQVIAGFAGGTADAFTLFERFEEQLEKHHGKLTRAAVELAKLWRTEFAGGHARWIERSSPQFSVQTYPKHVGIKCNALRS